MKKLFVLIFSIAIAGLLSGCATLSKNECLEANWFEVGYRDGNMGKPRAVFQEHVDSCAKHRVKPNRDAYYKGRHEGLKLYCTKQNGYKLGKLGAKYQYACPPELEPKFLDGYVKGKRVHAYKSKIASFKKHLKNIEKEIGKKEAKLLSTGLSGKQRAKIRFDIKELDIEYRDTVRKLKHLQRAKPI
jgi:hypothetical protein